VFQILGIDHVVLRVRDAPRMTRFYCDVLGCNVERERPDLGLIQLRAGASLIDLIAVNGEPGKPGEAGGARHGRNMDHVCVRVEPFDQPRIIAHLIANSVVPGEVKTRFGADGYGPSLYISDPEGNVVELKGPPDREAR